MFRAGGGGSSSWELKTEIITTNDIFVAPTAKNQEFTVTIFGGGGQGNCKFNNSTFGNGIYAGGGSGWMNKQILKLNVGEEVSINIGSGGRTGSLYGGQYITGASNGGTTSFGTYLSANGGCKGCYTQLPNGSDGGSGGGIFSYYPAGTGVEPNNNAARGYQFGGGGIYIGKGPYGVRNAKVYIDNGGRGGNWGGGGGIIIECNNYSNIWYSNVGIGGSNGGNGSRFVNYETNGILTPSNGTNTMSNSELEANFKGHGICGSGTYAGGGGYGGNGGNSINNGIGGGGGWAAKGGDGYKIFPGGGGGYGSGGKGGDGNTNAAGGGGGYGSGGQWNKTAGYGAGGCGIYNIGLSYGGNGICIIQYYAKA